MGYWFEDPTLKALAPLALSSSIRGLTTIFNTPKIYAGFNVLPEGPVIGPTTMDMLDSRCPQKRERPCRWCSGSSCPWAADR